MKYNVSFNKEILSCGFQNFVYNQWDFSSTMFLIVGCLFSHGFYFLHQAERLIIDWLIDRLNDTLLWLRHYGNLLALACSLFWTVHITMRFLYCLCVTYTVKKKKRKPTGVLWWSLIYRSPYGKFLKSKITLSTDKQKNQGIPPAREKTTQFSVCTLRCLHLF